MAKILMIIENNHFQYESGFLSEEHWQLDLEELKCTFEQPYYRELVDGWIWRKSFKTVIDAAFADSISNPSGCWDFEWNYPISE